MWPATGTGATKPPDANPADPRERIASLTLPGTPFYGGHVIANFRADGSETEPSTALKTSISGISVAPLLTYMAGFKHLEGALKAEFDVTGAGGTTRDHMQSLQRTANVGFFGWSHRIDIATLYNNRQREDQRPVTGRRFDGGLFKQLLR
ncbi:AsmA family protein [Sinorhizobium meliloti]|nr:AsmA family protein [Sinorhizobium meliloti]MDE3764955.1 AsmA family protein [Sinorhizobium meliloti]MDE3778725.1 AsmA family protein [Sinorhizobium meliloti]MDE3802906.1 AsmA family protein [Sinorhizobium meliloti]